MSKIKTFSHIFLQIITLNPCQHCVYRQNKKVLYKMDLRDIIIIVKVSHKNIEKGGKAYA
jgi:hypothetical protein